MCEQRIFVDICNADDNQRGYFHLLTKFCYKFLLTKKCEISLFKPSKTYRRFAYTVIDVQTLTKFAFDRSSNKSRLALVWECFVETKNIVNDNANLISKERIYNDDSVDTKDNKMLKLKSSDKYKSCMHEIINQFYKKSDFHEEFFMNI